MADLDDQFDEAVRAAVERRQAPPHVQTGAAISRLDALEAEATGAGTSEERERAMRHFIQLVGELGQQGG